MNELRLKIRDVTEIADLLKEIARHILTVILGMRKLSIRWMLISDQKTSHLIIATVFDYSTNPIQQIFCVEREPTPKKAKGVPPAEKVTVLGH